MVNDSYYNVENHGIWFSAKETAFRTNAEGKDTTNLNSTAHYRMMGRLRQIPGIFMKRNTHHNRVANIGPDFGHLALGSYGPGSITLTFEMIDLSMMYFLCGACTTAAAYTHTYATTTARAKTSFQLIYKYYNTEAGNSLTKLYTGCVLKSAEITGDVGSEFISMTITILFANQIDGTALTTEPTFGTLKPYRFDQASVTLLKATVAYPGKCRGFRILYDNGTMLHKAANETNPEEMLLGPRNIVLGLTWAHKDETLIEDTQTAQLAPETASDIDSTIKLSRDASTDFTSFAFQKLWAIDPQDLSWAFQSRFSQMELTYILKPVDYEAGAVLTILETNALTNARYEGA